MKNGLTCPKEEIDRGTLDVFPQTAPLWTGGLGRSHSEPPLWPHTPISGRMFAFREIREAPHVLCDGSLGVYVRDSNM